MVKRRMISALLVTAMMLSTVMIDTSAEVFSSIDEETILCELQKYYSSRYDGIGDICKDYDTVLRISDKVEEENQSRKAGLIRAQKAASVTYYDVDCTIRDFSFEEGEESDYVCLSEYVTIDYLDSGVTDSFSFKVPHKLAITDDMTIVSDVYCENTVSGFDNTIECYDSNDTYNDDESESGTGNFRSYNMNNVISYAQMYALSANPTYGYLSGGDCANFVSQCLYEGGVPFDGYGNYNNGWYFVFSSHSGSKPWVQVNAFDTFWLGKGMTRQTGNTNNLIPGNPFYWRSEDSSTGTGHLMICTGYNAAGNLVYCAHNTDVLNGLVSSALSSNTGNKYTLLFHSKCSSHSFPGTWKYNSSSHWWYCTVCGVKRNMEGHNYIYSGNYMTCRVCGYTRHV